MNAKIQELPIANEVQIVSKKVRIAIKDGEKVLGEIAFNPDDSRTFERFIGLIEKLTARQKEAEGIRIDENELDQKLETVEDFENAAGLINKIRQASNIASQTVAEVCAGLDEIFGEGVCEIFMQGDQDVELLFPLIDVVSPHFQKEREAKTNKYRVKK